MSDPTTPTPAPAYAPTPAAAGLDPSKWLPIDRLSKVVGERDALQVTLEAQTNETDIWREKAATADTLAGQLESMKAAHATEIGAWETKGAAYRHGVTDPDLVDLTVWQYGRIPAGEDGAKPAYADWLGALKSEPATLPASLAGLRDVWAAPAPADGPAPPAAAAVAPPAASPPPATYARGAIAKMTPAEYRQYKEAGRGQG